MEAATCDSASSSGSDSTLNWRTPSASACAISWRVLPTPEKTMRAPGTPAARARASSPPETTSIPAPSRASVLSTATLPKALTAKHTSRSGAQARASSKSRRWRRSVAVE